MKKVQTVALLCVALVLLGVSCRKDDIRTVVIRVPGMKNQACAERIVQALGQAQYGVNMGTIETDIENHRVTLAYDSMLLGLKNIEFIIAKVGFAANEVPADVAAVAALPEACR